VPRPMICLKVVIDSIRWSRTMSLQVRTSTPVLSNRDVVTITGYLLSGRMKVSSSALPWDRPRDAHDVFVVLHHFGPFHMMRAWRIRSAWSMSSQKTMVLAKRSVAFRY